MAILVAKQKKFTFPGKFQTWDYFTTYIFISSGVNATKLNFLPKLC